jgi:ubiquinone/menaquinone biosynthesis C-methylase UbiE
VTGLDPDPKALARARKKGEEAGLEIEWVTGYAGRAPFPAHGFDRVLSSLMIHHLRTEEKQAAFRDVLRLLRPGGSFHLLDFGPPQDWLDRALAAALHHGGRMADNREGRLPAWLAEAGFGEVRELERRRTWIGPVSLIAARAPA